MENQGNKMAQIRPPWAQREGRVSGRSVEMKCLELNGTLGMTETKKREQSVMVPGLLIWASRTFILSSDYSSGLQYLGVSPIILQGVQNSEMVPE